MNEMLKDFADRIAVSPFAGIEHQYRMVFDTATDGLFIVDLATGRFIEVNQSGCQMFGYDKCELIGSEIGMLSSGIHPYTQETAVDKSRRAYAGEPQTFEWQCKTKDEGLFWAEVTLRYTEFGFTPTIVANVRNITGRKEQTERFRQLAENIAEAFWMCDLKKTTTLYVSPGYEAIWGRSCQSLYENPDQWLEAIHEEDRDRIAELYTRGDYPEFNEEYRIVRSDGEVRWVSDRAFPVRDENGKVYRIAGVARDITERKKLSAQVEYLAHHDALTGLANRSMFTSALDRAIAQSHRTGKPFAILLLDLDHFKDVNDTRGHPTGDRLLQLVAERLQDGIRLNETAFRLGGDEFAIVVSETQEQAEIGTLADRLIDSISAPFVIDDLEIHVGASIGVAIYGEGSCDADGLMIHADTALYRAKADGRGGCRFYSDAINEAVRSRVALTDELRRAIAHGQLFLAYQPQVTGKGGRIAGVEALVRWKHPVYGVLNPASFLPVAESNGLIVALDRWVLREACRQARQWIDTGVAAGTMCVNLSSAHFKEPLELEGFVLATLEETGLPAHLLELEISESTLIGLPSENREMIQRLRDTGVKFALDDFGTGYSSLNYLRLFAIDRIKIAREFVADLDSNADAATIVKCILNLAHALGNDVIAEGVETSEQHSLLLEWGCPDIQGFYFARPMTAEAIAPLLTAGRINPVDAIVPSSGHTPSCKELRGHSRHHEHIETTVT